MFGVLSFSSHSVMFFAETSPVLLLTKTQTSQKTNKLREIETAEMLAEILPPQGKVKYLGQMITFVDKETTDERTQDPMRLVRIRQTSTRTDTPILLASTPISPVRRCCHTYKRNAHTMNTTKTAVFHSMMMMMMTARPAKKTHIDGWIEYIERGTKEVDEKMPTYNIAN